MNRRVTFVLGLAVGVAATLAMQERGTDAAVGPVVVPETATRTRAPSIDPAARSAPAAVPAPARVAAAPDRPSAVDAVRTPTLDEALADRRGDVESVVVSGDTFLGGNVRNLLTGDDFSRFVLALSRTPSVAAAENHQRLLDEYQRLVGVREGAVAVQQLACGQRVCAVSLVGYDRASVEATWAEIADRPAGTGRMRSGGIEFVMAQDTVIGSTTVDGTNGIERRLLISVDPAVRSYTTGSVAVHPDGPPGG